MPCIPLRIPVARSEPKELLMMFPQYRIHILSPSSSRVYHFESRNKAPGKKAAFAIHPKDEER